MEPAANRLELKPLAPTHWLALIEGTEPFAEAFGMPAADGLREFLFSGHVSPQWLAQLRTRHNADFWIDGFGAVERATRTMVGTAGFKGPPDADGMVEIGYGIAPAYQGQGYATEAASLLVGVARERAVRLIRAHTLPERNASCRVLEKCGFTHTGEVVDPDDGPVWRWELRCS